MPIGGLVHKAAANFDEQAAVGTEEKLTLGLQSIEPHV